MSVILITGSTGFLGQHLIRRLLETDEDSHLRLLCRGQGPAVESDRIEVVSGDVTDRAAVDAAMDGVAGVYHLAGRVERESDDNWSIYDVHVEGTRNVCESIIEKDVEKLVVVSTSGAMAVGVDPVERSEEFPYAQEVVRDWPYYTSKIYAEKLALWFAEHRKAPIVVVNPSLILGPGDERRSSTRDVELFLKGQIMVTPIGGLNLVDVRDAAQGLTLAMEKGRLGERYLLGGANMTFHEWIQRTSKISGVSAPTLMVPLRTALGGAAVMRRLMPLVGKKFELDNASIKMSALFWYCDSSKARDELGFTTRDPDETLRDTVSYLRETAA